MKILGLLLGGFFMVSSAFAEAERICIVQVSETYTDDCGQGGPGCPRYYYYEILIHSSSKELIYATTRGFKEDVQVLLREIRLGRHSTRSACDRYRFARPLPLGGRGKGFI